MFRTTSLLLALSPLLAAEDLGGGRPAAHGRVPRFVLERWIPGGPSAFAFEDLSSTTVLQVGILSTGRSNLVLPGIGTLIADLGAPGALSFSMPQRLALAQLPPALAGATFYIQGAVLDGSGVLLTDATRVDCFQPIVMVGNQRQSSNSISVIDLQSRSVIQTLTNSENGSIAFAPSRKYAYVCEPGLQRNRVVIYDLSTSPITSPGTIAVSGGIRYQPAIARDGKRMYVPIHSGVSVVDTDPASSTFHTELLTIPTPITGSSGAIFEGPFDCAVTPDGKKLLVAYGERVATYQTPGTLGIIDLTLPTYPHQAVPITNSGALTLLGTPLVSRQRVEVSGDGRHAYLVEFAFKPGAYVVGFQNGGAVNVVDLQTNAEVAVIPFGGFAVHEFALDRNSRNLWVAANDLQDFGQVARIDVDRHSATRWQVRKRIQVDPVAYSAGGAFGVGCTPDGATVCVSLCEDGAHASPVLITIDAWTDTIFGAPIPVQSLPATVGIPLF